MAAIPIRLAVHSGIAIALLLNGSFAVARGFRSRIPDPVLNHPVETGPQSEKLSLDHPVQGTLKGGDRHSFEVDLKTEQFVRIVASPKDIDVVISLVGPEGQKLREVSSLTSIEGEPSVFWVAEKDGVYNFEVRPLEADARPGNYLAKITELRPSIARDRNLVAGEVALAEGDLLLAGRTPDASTSALGKFDEALTLFRLGQEPARVAYALRRKAYVLAMNGDFPNARSLYDEAVQRLEARYGLDHMKVAPALWESADIVARLGDLPKAAEMDQRALNIINASLGPDSIPAAVCLTYFTSVLMAQGQDERALAASEQARRINEKRYGEHSVQAANAYITVANVLQRQNQLPRAQTLLERALDNYEKRFGPNAAALLNPLYALAQVLRNRGNSAEALAKHERALRIIENEYGRESRAAFNAWLDIGRDLVVGDDFEKARIKFDEALKLAEKLEGKDSRAVAFALMDKLAAYPGANDYAAGRECYNRALQIYENIDQEAFANSLGAAAEFDIDHNFKPAGRAKFEQGIKIYEKLDGSDSVRAAHMRLHLGQSLIEEAKGNEAVDPLQQVVKIYEKSYGKNHPALLTPLKSLARALAFQSRFPEAEEVLNHSLKILEENHLGEKLIAAETLGVVAGLLGVADKRAEAQEMAENSIKIYDVNREYGLSDDEIDTRNVLVEILLSKGKWPRAREVLDRTIALIKQHPGRSSKSLLATYIQMAFLLLNQGDTGAASRYLVDLQANSSSIMQSEDIEALPYFNLAAIVFGRLGKTTEARQFTKKAADIAEASFGPASFITARVLAVQATTLMALGDYAAGEEMAAKAEKAFELSGTEHVTRALPLIVKGELLIERGKDAEGRTAIEAAVDILVRQLGSTNQFTAKGYGRLGWLDQFSGHAAQAQSLFLKGGDAAYYHMQNVLPMLSLAEQQIFLEMEMPEQISGLLTSCRDGAVLRNAYDLMFRWKGSLIDSLRRQTVINRLGQSRTSSDEVKRLTTVRSEIAGWYRRVEEVPTEEWRKKNDQLTQEKETLERALARTLKPGELDDPLMAGLGGFQPLLKPDEVFLDVYVYQYRRSDSNIETRYAAILTGPTGDPVLVDLGPIRRINEAVKAWRDEVLASVDSGKEWEALATFLWKPLADALPTGARKVWVSPDGELARFPWQLLPATNAKTKNLLLTQANSARELARLRQPRDVPATTAPGNILLVGNIDFNSGLSEKDARAAKGAFEPLDATQVEIEAIRAIAQKFQTVAPPVTGNKASKSKVVDELQSATYAHLATHGYFARELKVLTRPSEQTRWAPLFDEIPPATRNPLVESGIALAGANVVDPLTLDVKGLLTAEEIIGLDLRRCELVTLSACETGRGEEVTGQGVIGLRASVMAAGSRSMLMSLWKVPDEATVKFMKAFYQNLWIRKMTKAEALLAAQEAVRDEPSGKNKLPYYWAGWVLVGEGW